jgi:hypothetical protein
MTTLKCLQERKQKIKLAPPANPDKCSIMKKDDLMDLFPLPRYFQVHFEHIHECVHEVQGKIDYLNDDLHNQLDQLNETLVKVEGKLDRFIALLDDHIKEPEH